MDEHETSDDDPAQLAPPTPAGPSDQLVVRWTLRLSGPVVSPLLAYVLTRVTLVLAWYYGWAVSHFAGLGQMLSGWYGQYNLEIAASGYVHGAGAPSSPTSAFFPGYPIAVRVAHVVSGLSLVEAGILISWVGGGFFVVTAGRLAATLYGDAAGRRAGVLLAVFPGTLVLGLPYGEGLALALSAWSLLSVARDRPWRAGVAGALAGLCSPLAAPIVIVLGLRALRERSREYAGAAGVAALGPLGALGLISAVTGSLLSWPLSLHRGLGATVNVVSLLTHLHHWPGTALTELASLGALALAVVACVRVRVPLEWTVYGAGVILVVLIDGGSWLNPRFLLDAFPLLLGLGVWLKRDAYRAATYAFAALLPVVFLLYMTLGNVMGPP